MHSKIGYAFFSQLLHWVIAMAIGVSWYLAEQANEAIAHGENVRALALFANHKSVGMTIFALAVVRVVWRSCSARPPLPQTMPRWQHHASAISHYLLYGLLLGLPLTGWLGSSASAYSVSWFNLFSFPDLIDASEPLSERLYELHHWLWTALIWLLLLHVAAALKHALIDRDGVFSSMWGHRSVALSLGVVALAIILVVQLQRVPDNTVATEAKGASSSETESGLVNDAAALDELAARWHANFEAATENSPLHRISPWVIDYARSEIAFTADQAGASFTGTFSDWRGVIRWEPPPLEPIDGSRKESMLPEFGFDIQIDLAGADTLDAERDETLFTESFFATGQFPTARFVAVGVRLTNNTATPQYEADGYLLLKGQVHPVKFVFSVEYHEASSRGVTLRGHATLNRHRWRIGEGEWADNSWIGPDVSVDVVVATIR